METGIPARLSPKEGRKFGLLVGGVLVGQDLIKAAEIRAVASDIERYNTGAAAFRTKYNGLPGDLLATTASGFSLPYGEGAAS